MISAIYKSPVASEIPFDNTEATWLTGSEVNTAVIEASIPGSQFHYASNTSTASTTSTTTYSTYVTLTTSSLSSGNYAVTFLVNCSTAASNREIDTRVMLDTTVLYSARSSNIRTQGTLTISGALFTGTISGVKTLSIEFRVGGTATTASCLSGYLMLWRAQ